MAPKLIHEGWETDPPNWEKEDWDIILRDLTEVFQRMDIAEEVRQLCPFYTEGAEPEVTIAGVKRAWLELRNHSYLTYDDDFGVIMLSTPEDVVFYEPYHGRITSYHTGTKYLYLLFFHAIKDGLFLDPA